MWFSNGKTERNRGRAAGSNRANFTFPDVQIRHVLQGGVCKRAEHLFIRDEIKKPIQALF
jgi:hypothetical protein